MKKFKTAQQAWLFLYQQFDLYGKHGKVKCNDINRSGICNAIDQLLVKKLITKEIEKAMFKELDKNESNSDRPNYLFWFHYTFTRHGAMRRARFIKKYLL